MKPTLLKVPNLTGNSFNFRIDRGEKLINTWHFHPEIELLLLKKTAGTRIIGDAVQYFRNNEVLLISPDLPHTFIHHPQYLKEKNNEAAAYVIHFLDSFLGDFLSLPEAAEIKKLLKNSKLGLLLLPKYKSQVISLLDKMPAASATEKLLLLLHILKIFALKNAAAPIVSQGFVYTNIKVEDEDRINKIYAYTAENFDRAISIIEVAELTYMTKEAFCRFFKAKTGKTFFKFLNEFRIGNACRLLIENKMSVKDIGYSCGYDNVSNFHHQFKSIMSKSPIQYQTEYFDLATRNNITE